MDNGIDYFGRPVSYMNKRVLAKKLQAPYYLTLIS